LQYRASTKQHVRVTFLCRLPGAWFAATAALSPASYYPLPPINSTARKHPAFLGDDNRFDEALWKKLNYTTHLDSYLKQERVVPLYLSAGDRDIYDAASRSASASSRASAAGSIFRGAYLACLAGKSRPRVEIHVSPPAATGADHSVAIVAIRALH